MIDVTLGNNVVTSDGERLRRVFARQLLLVENAAYPFHQWQIHTHSNGLLASPETWFKADNNCRLKVLECIAQ